MSSIWNKFGVIRTVCALLERELKFMKSSTLQHVHIIQIKNICTSYCVSASHVSGSRRYEASNEAPFPEKWKSCSIISFGL